MLEQLLGHKEELMASDVCTWGYLVFVLDNRSQTDTGIEPPKWEPNTRTGICLGHSPFHAGNVALVLNLQTGHMSPQYHFVFDDELSTVLHLQSSEPPPNLIDLVQNHTELATEESFNIASSCYEGESAHRTEQLDSPEEMRELPKQDFINFETPAHMPQCFQANMIQCQEFLDTSFDETHNNLSVIKHVFSSELNNENYTLKEMLQQSDREEFKLAIYKEVNHNFDKKVWEKVP
eukprot:11887801-Ditylum_brightwellii.AAC.2